MTTKESYDGPAFGNYQIVEDMVKVDRMANCELKGLSFCIDGYGGMCSVEMTFKGCSKVAIGYDECEKCDAVELEGRVMAY